MFLKNVLTQSLKLLNCSSSYLKISTVSKPASSVLFDLKLFSSTVQRHDLMEFFDDKNNLTEDKIKHGRAWRIDELRLKSNLDLHKLWYVLHKERNMLLTMEEAFKKQVEPFPSPERITKVDESMENLMSVVDERNIAYNLLETGETKKIIPYRRYNSFGHIQSYRPREYLVPWWLNKMWKLKYHYKRLPLWSKFYRTLLRVKLRQERRKIVRGINYEKKMLLKKYPDLIEDTDYLQKVLEKKRGYRPPIPYHELIRQPLPNELPKYIVERSRKKNTNEDDQF